MFEKVVITEIGLPGLITEIKVVSNCEAEILYVVEYWCNYTMHSVNLQGGEIQALPPQKKAGVL